MTLMDSAAEEKLKEPTAAPFFLIVWAEPADHTGTLNLGFKL